MTNGLNIEKDDVFSDSQIHRLSQSLEINIWENNFKQGSFVWWLVTMSLPLGYITEVFIGAQVWRLGSQQQCLDLVALQLHLHIRGICLGVLMVNKYQGDYAELATT